MWPFNTKEKLFAIPTEGAGGKFRWELMDKNHRVVALQPVHGYDTMEEARQAAKRIDEAEIVFERWPS